MTPGQRRVVVFGLQFIPLFVVIVWIYAKTVPYYQPLVLGTANAVTQRMSPPTRMELLWNGEWQYYRFTPETGDEAVIRWSTNVPHLFLLSLAMVPALLLATPAPIGLRLRWVALSLPLLFLVHVVSVTGLMRGTQCLQSDPGTFICLWTLRLVYTSGQLFGVALWALVSWRYWFPRSASA